ncbi:MAG: phosphoribulokinase, partial [Ectothiorhodospiraceae bacterium]
TNADIIIKIHESELASLAMDEYKGQIPENCYHMEIVVSPTDVTLPSLYMPVDLNNMTRQQAMPFMLATVPSSYWGKPVNVVHIDGVMPQEALHQLEDEIMRLTGIHRAHTHHLGAKENPSTILFTQLLVAWPVLGHIIALLQKLAGSDQNGSARLSG